MRVLRSLAVTLLLTALAGGSLASARSLRGPLDASFGAFGKVRTRIGLQSEASAVAQQRDGKLVVAGWTETGDQYDFAVVRYRRDGSLDRSFGRRGVVTTDFGRNESAFAMRLQRDGKIVLAGVTYDDQTWQLALTRYTHRGSLDRTFGSGGKEVAAGSPGAFALVLQPDGKIVVGGGANRAFVVSRFNSDGSPDLSFGTDGRATSSFEMLGGSLIRGLVVQPDRKIVAVGWNDEHERAQWAVARFLRDGELDPSFGTGGKVTLFPVTLANSLATAVAVQPDGKLLVAGDNYDGAALVRLLPNGSLDPAFGDSGVALPGFEPRGGFSTAVRIQRDGKIVLAGGTYDGQMSGDFAIARYTRNGVLDTRFWGAGKLTTSITPAIDTANALLLQRDGKVVLAGQAGGYGPQGPAFALLRYRKR